MSNTYIKRPLLRPFLGQRPNAKRNLHLRIIAGLSAMTIAGFGATPVHASTTFTNQTVTTPVVFANDGGNFAQNSIFDSTIDLTQSGAYARLIDGNTFNGTTTMATTDGLHLQDGSSLLTIGSTGIVQGYGRIIQDNNNATVVNNGTIDANNSSGSLLLAVTNLSNANLFEATNGGTLQISSTDFTNSGAVTANGGNVDLTSAIYTGEAGSTLNQEVGQILDDGTTLTGDITITGSTGLSFTTNGSNIINAATITGNLDLATNSNAYVQFQGASTFDDGTINLNSLAGGNGIHVHDGNSVLTIGSNGTVNGAGYIIQDYSNATFTNNGLLNANISGEPLTVAVTNLNNNGTAEATNGGLLSIESTNVTNNGAITAATGSEVDLDGGTFVLQANSTLNQQGTGVLMDNGATLEGNVDITGATGLTFNTSGNNIINTATVQGNINLDNASHSSYVRIVGTDTYDQGTITLGETAGGNGIHLQDGNSNLTFGSNATVNGYGYIIQDYANSTLTNNGVIDATRDGLFTGETLTLGVTNLNNNGTLEATSGGMLDVASTTVVNTGTIKADGGDVYLQSGDYVGKAGSSLDQVNGSIIENGTQLGDGTIAGGIIDVTGTQGLLFTTSGSNIINTGTVTGNLDLDNSTNSSYVLFVNANTYDDGTITLAEAAEGNGIHLHDGNASLTLGANAHVNGYGYIIQDNSNAQLINNGTIKATSDGLNPAETLSIGVTSFTNNAVTEATNGGQLDIASIYVDNNSEIDANGGNVLLQSGEYIGHAGSSLNQISGQFVENGTQLGDGSLAGGIIDVTGTQGLLFTTSGFNIINTGTVTGNLDLDNSTNSSYVRFVNANTYDDGTITLAEAAEGNGIHLQDGNASLTLGSNAHVNGYGYIIEDNSNSHLVNNGTIDAENDGLNAGETLAIQVTNFGNTGTTEATNGGVLSVQSGYDTNSGSIVAENGSTAEFNGGTYIGETGGTIGQVGTGQLLANNTTFTGDVAIQGATGLTFNTSGGNVIINANVTGNLDLATNTNAYVRFVNTDTFDAGTINIATTGGGNGVHLQDGNANLTIGSQGAIQGFGVVTQDNSNASLINNGTITANTSGQTLAINVSNFTNNGTLDAQNGATITSNNFSQGSLASTSQLVSNILVAGPPEQTQVDGTLTIGGGGGTETVNSGLVEGTGTINGSIDNQGGTVKGGDSPGTLTINGNYNQAPAGTFLEQLAGTPNSGLFDVVDVTGTASLAGTLDVSLLNGFAPVVGDEFTFLNATGGVNGTFDPTIVGPSGYSFDVVYGANDAVLQIESAPANAPAPESSTAVSFGMMLLAGLGFLGFKSFRRRQED